MKQNIRRNYNIRNITELKQAIKKEWHLYNDEKLINLYDGM